MRFILFYVGFLWTMTSMAQKKIAFEKLSSMPNESYAIASASSDRDIFALTGGDDFQAFGSELQIYDTKIDLWIKMTLKDLPLSNGLSVVYMEDYHGLITLGGVQPYGSNANLVEKIRMIDLEDYSIMELGVLPEPARHIGTAKKDNTIYFFGGSTKATPTFQCSDQLFSYDLDLGHLEMLPSMPLAMETKGVIMKDQLYVFGGYNNTALSKVFKYDLRLREWTELPSLDKPLSDYAITQYGDYIIIVGDYVRTNQLIVYDTKSNTLKYHKMNIEARKLGASIVGDYLYVYGGYNSLADGYVKQETYRLNIKSFIENL